MKEQPDHAQAELRPDPRAAGGWRLVYRPGFGHPVPDAFWSRQARQEQMAAAGIDAMVLSPAPPLFYYWAEPETGVEVARRVNDGVAKAVAEDPGRLHGLATLPMADPAAAAVELTHHPKALAFLVDLVGADRVVLGSDFPFDMAEWPPSRVLSAALVR